MTPATTPAPDTEASETPRIARCPRCHANPITLDAPAPGTAMSHAAFDIEGDSIPSVEMDDGSRRALICGECDRREFPFMLDADLVVPPVSEWPLSVEELVAEDRVRIEMGRATEYQS